MDIAVAAVSSSSSMMLDRNLDRDKREGDDGEETWPKNRETLLSCVVSIASVVFHVSARWKQDGSQPDKRAIKFLDGHVGFVPVPYSLPYYCTL